MPLSTLSFSFGKKGRLVTSDSLGRLHILECENFEFGPPIVTAFENRVRCRFCLRSFDIPQSKLGGSCQCPHCSQILQVNSFQAVTLNPKKIRSRASKLREADRKTFQEKYNIPDGSKEDTFRSMQKTFNKQKKRKGGSKPVLGPKKPSPFPKDPFKKKKPKKPGSLDDIFPQQKRKE
jgi:hypothetical protein